MNLKIESIDLDFTICKVKEYGGACFDSEFAFACKTDNEKSLVCPTSDVPPNTTAREDGWRMFRIVGTLDFSLVGILSEISKVLADNGIGIFAVSTFDTDYILTKKENMPSAIKALRENGFDTETLEE